MRNKLFLIVAVGFTLTVASQYFPPLLYVIFVFLGAGSIYCWLNPLFGFVFLAKRYPYLNYAFHDKLLTGETLRVQTGMDEGLRANGEHFADESRQNLCRNAFDKLSNRELEVANYMLQGMSYREIAMQLNIHPSTVSVHQRNLYSKLQIHSKRELYILANKL